MMPSVAVTSAERDILSFIKSEFYGRAYSNLKSTLNSPDCQLSLYWQENVSRALWSATSGKTNVSQEDLEFILNIYTAIASPLFPLKDNELLAYFLKGCGSVHRFFVSKQNMPIINVGELMLRQLKNGASRFFSNSNDQKELSNICHAFYGTIWNHMRVVYEKQDSGPTLKLISQSVRFLLVGCQFEVGVVGSKLLQVSAIVLKSNDANSMRQFADGIVKLFAHLLSENPLMVKKSITGSDIDLKKMADVLQLQFIIVRFLIHVREYHYVREFTKSIIAAVGQHINEYFVTSWENVMEMYASIFEYLLTYDTSSDSAKVITTVSSTLKKLKTLVKVESCKGFVKVLILEFMSAVGTGFLSETKNGSVPFCATSSEKDCSVFVGCLLSIYSDFRNVDFGKVNKDDSKILLERQKDANSAFLNCLYRMISDRINQPIAETLCQNEVLKNALELCFTKLLKYSQDLTDNTDARSRLCNTTTQLAYGHQKLKKYEESVFWSTRVVDLIDSMKLKQPYSLSSSTGLLSLGLWLADSLRNLRKYEKGLVWLTDFLHRDPSVLNTVNAGIDLYEPSIWTDWGHHWMLIKKDLNLAEGHCGKSVVEYIKREKKETSFVVKSIIYEISTYHSHRFALPTATIIAGEALEDWSQNLKQMVLGIIVQASGWWWGRNEQFTHGYELCQVAFQYIGTLLEDEAESDDSSPESNLMESAQSKNSDKLEAYLLSALAHTWMGFCLLKKNQTIAIKDLSKLKFVEFEKHPEKYKGFDKDTAMSRAVQGLSSLTLEEEVEAGNHFVKAASYFYGVFKDDLDLVIPILERSSVSFLITSCRLLSYMLTSLGHYMYAIKAWMSTLLLAKRYNRTGLLVLCASELLKLTGDVNADFVKWAEEADKKAESLNYINQNNRAVHYRLILAKSIASYNNKDYKKGFEYLKEVLNYRSAQENFDTTQHCLAECLIVLSWYQRMKPFCKLDFSNISPTLARMSQAGLAMKGYRLLMGLCRTPDPNSPCWMDVFQNYFVMSSLMQHASYISKVLLEAGKLRELKVLAPDIITFAQELGFTSRSVEVVLHSSMAEIYMSNLDGCHFNIYNVAKIFFPALSEEPSCDSKAIDVASRLAKEKIDVNILEYADADSSNINWTLDKIDDAENSNSGDMSMCFRSPNLTIPTCLRHNLNCCCYVCSHPHILQCSLRYLLLQATYAISSKNVKDAIVILESMKSQHLRAILRLMMNFEEHSSKFSDILTPESSKKCVWNMFRMILQEPADESLLFEMSIIPIGNGPDALPLLMKYRDAVSQLVDMMDSADYSPKWKALETVQAGVLYQILTSPELRENTILGTNIRKRINDAAQKKAPSFHDQISPNIEVQMTMKEPIVKKKGLAAKAKDLKFDGRPGRKLLALVEDPCEGIFDLDPPPKPCTVPFAFDDDIETTEESSPEKKPEAQKTKAAPTKVSNSRGRGRRKVEDTKLPKTSRKK